MQQQTENGARRTRVLICEDEAIVALDLKLMVEDLGYEVIGPFATVRDGLNATGQGDIDVAVLDVRLRDGEVFPVADALTAQGTGLIFHSGHVLSSEILGTYPLARVCQKPVATAALTAYLGEFASAVENAH